MWSRWANGQQLRHSRRYRVLQSMGGMCSKKIASESALSQSLLSKGRATERTSTERMSMGWGAALGGRALSHASIAALVGATAWRLQGACVRCVVQAGGERKGEAVGRARVPQHQATAERGRQAVRAWRLAPYRLCLAS